MKILFAENLSIGYNQPLQENINIVLETGQVTCLLGKNGTGKSTFLKTLFGQLLPLNGQILLESKKIQTISAEQMAKKIALVLTENLDQVFLTVEEVVGLGRYPYLNFFGRLSKDDHQIVHNALEATEIENLKNRFFHELSDGQKQKVMIAKALAQETSIILLDEPFAFLDYPSKLKTFALLRKIAITQNKAILIVLHELELAIQMADYLWLLDNSKQLLSGVPEDLILEGNFATYFEQENVVFNVNTGKFDLIKEDLKIVELIGENQKIAFWLKNALLKQGYQIGDNSLFQIYFSNNEYKINRNNQQKVVTSVQELLYEIKKYEKN